MKFRLPQLRLPPVLQLQQWPTQLLRLLRLQLEPLELVPAQDQLLSAHRQLLDLVQ